MATTKACAGCQAAIPTDARFCPQCGAPQALACAACGHVNAAGSKFCAQCGARLEAGASPSPAPAPRPPAARTAAPRAAQAAERRQLTVMFCDLVGSTALSTQLDPEDLRDVIAAYHKCAAEVVSRLGGYVAKYMGDGILIYFGYPDAHEADAENAVRAALALTEAVTKLFAQGGHKIRIGIATGLVVVGELVGTGEAQERNVVGETPNLAARLQSAAAPNTAVIDATTRRLAGELFEYEPIEPTALKGFAEPVAAWKILRERTIASRFEALRAAGLAPLIGRDEEMELLLRRWKQIKDGEGRVVLLAGEAGIGKSRLTTALEERLKLEAHMILRYFCQPHHQGSALQPVVSQIQHVSDFKPTDTPAEKRRKLQDRLGPETDAEPFAELLGIAERASAEVTDPQRSRRRMLGALIGRLETLARRGPVLMVFEDAHWADPTSLELLTLAVERLQKLPILLVIAFRPDFQAPWAGQPHVTTMALNRLSQRARAALVEHITGGKALPPQLLDQIVERTDGVPLFVEELTKALLESDQLHEDRGRYVLEQPMQQVSIPTTLQASLMARVDRLGSAREVLQIGSAIGRDFSYDVLAAVAGLPDAVLQDALTRLIEAELLFLRGTPPNAVYTFKHALVQDTAYSAMLRARRQQLHSAIALVLEKRHPELVETTPEVLAQQFEQAGQSHKAIAYWQRAGERELRRFAIKECVGNYANALRLVMALPNGQQRDETELAVRLGFGVAQMIARGPTAPEAAEHYRCALALSRALQGRGRERFLATWGVWFNASVSGRPEAEEMADQLVAIARELDNSNFLLEAYHAKCPMLLRAADFDGLSEAAREVVRLYDRERHRDHAYYFGGHDSRMCAQSFYAQGLWGQGLFDQARQMALRSIADARDLGHVFSLAHALQRGGLTMMLLEDVAACRAVAEELYPLAERNKFAWQLADAIFLRGWIATMAGDFKAGFEQMTHGVNQPFNPGFRPLFLLRLAEQLLRAGRPDESEKTLTQALRETREHSNHFCEPDIIRLHGEVLLAQSRDNAAEAERIFREALALASAQSCRPLELRSALSLARLMTGTTRRAEAHDLLAPIYATFTEGFERPDLQAAKATLAELD
jgi:class 3 adenylate cyclase/tetratricopeptide (TPR) repeat protein/RNA polymerase subunit RPABC4/transcription elongation factor Spt4